MVTKRKPEKAKKSIAQRQQDAAAGLQDSARADVPDVASVPQKTEPAVQSAPAPVADATPKKTAEPEAPAVKAAAKTVAKPSVKASSKPRPRIRPKVKKAKQDDKVASDQILTEAEAREHLPIKPPDEIEPPLPPASPAGLSDDNATDGFRVVPGADTFPSEDDAHGDDPSKREGRRRSVKHTRRWPLITAAAIVAALLVVAGLFSWDRWLRYDDTADMTGDWNVAGTTTVVVIDEQTIRLTDDVSYEYVLDTQAKTIRFTFGTLEGQGRYRFSADRSQLAIMEGGDYSWVSTMFDDIAWSFGNLVRGIQGQPAADPGEGDAVTALVRAADEAASAEVAPAEAAPADAVAEDAASADAISASQDDPALV